MKIKNALLPLLLPVLLISCGNNSIDESFTSDDIPELNEETEIVMKRDFIKQYYQNSTRYKPQDVRILSYYGNYNENLAVIIDCMDPELSITKEIIFGYEFIYSTTTTMRIYSNHLFYKLASAYSSILSSENLSKLYDAYREANSYLYTTSAIN